MRPLGLGDIARAKKELGWLPVVTLDKGLDLTIEYAEANKQLVRFGKE